MYACVSVSQKTIEILDVGAGLGPMDLFLGAFTKFRKAAISFVMSVCLSSWNNSLPLDGFWWNFVFELYSKICRENSSPLKFYKNNGYFTRRLFTFITIYRSIFLSMRKSLDKNVDKVKTHISCYVTFSHNRAVYEIMSKNVVTPEEAQKTSQYGVG